jgi:hypothetical protein
MRTSVKLGAGLTSAAVVASLAAGVATAAVGSPNRPTASLTAATSQAHITKRQAIHLAKAAVPHSRLIEIESDDLHDRAIWKVKLATPRKRVVVAVDKRTGRVTILHGHRHGGGGGGHDDVLLSARSAMLVLSGHDRAFNDRGFEPGDDRGVDQRVNGRGLEPGDDRGVDQHGDDHGRDGLGQPGQGNGGQNRGPGHGGQGNGGQDDGPGHDAGHGGSGHG